MNSLQIDYFMAVATNLSFTKTSEELYVSQPAISKQIAILEKELGVKLFKRNNKTTELTDAGKLYYDLFKNFKSDLMKTQKAVESLIENQSKVIKIGFLEGWDLYNYIPGIISEFHKQYPDVRVVVSCCGIKELSTQILTGGLDLILTMKNSIIDKPEISYIDVCSISKNILYPSDSHYASKDYLSPIDFKDEVFFVPCGIMEKFITEMVHEYLKNYRFMPKLQFVTNHESMITCVRAGMGVAINDEWSWAKKAPGISYIDVDARDEVAIAYMNNNCDDIIRTMIKILQNAYYKGV